MTTIINLLVQNPLLLLFSVAAIGYLIGRVQLGGVKLGVAAVLFVGLFVGALDERLKLPDFVYLLGLVLFVYTIGLSSGPSFFRSLQRQGLRDNLMIVAIVILGTGLAVVAKIALGLSASVTAGMFAGSLTNTPALASVLETIARNAGGKPTDTIMAEPVVGYSVTYPIGVLGVIMAIYLLQRVWKIDYKAEAKELHDLGAQSDSLVNCTVRVSNPDVEDTTIGSIMRNHTWQVVFGRLEHNGTVDIATSETRLHKGDLITIVGASDEVAKAAHAIGDLAPVALDLSRQTIDYRRVFVSNQSIVGKPLRDLDLPYQHGTVITRIRRGDVDLLPRGDTMLQLGDRVRVLARRDRMDEVGHFFGDSYRELSEVDVVSLGLGIALGLLLGMIPLPLPGGTTFTLGFAGGPLLMALVLGWRERSGPFVWSMPYSANLTLRQFGLTLFLAGVGTRSGFSFAHTFMQGGGLPIFIAGAAITCITSLALLFVGHVVFKIPMSLLSGMAAGLQTQPAVLAFANEQSKGETPNIGYAAVYPIATISKILAAQLLLGLLK